MIKFIPVDGNKVRSLLQDVQSNIKELQGLAKLELRKFKADKKNYGLADHYLRRALEGILTIGTHLLSRLPAKTKDYQDVIKELARFKIVPKDFAEKNKKLASYRNRLVHMYWEVSEEELHKVVNDHIDDLDKFCRYFQKVLKNPDKFGLEVE